MTADYFLPTGEPTDQETALQLMTDQLRRLVGDDRVTDTTGNDAHVLTVFTPVRLDPADDPPHLWTTVIHGGAHDGVEWRYTSHEAAERGHNAVAAWARGDVLDPPTTETAA